MENRVSTPAHKQKLVCLFLVCPLNKGSKALFKGKYEKCAFFLSLLRKEHIKARFGIAQEVLFIKGG
ncbi:hypothetical protein BOO28_05100 [Vibrio navarrensis]|nr:hypothetical protein [Vibrio navarrensis]MBE4610579.1 hypothetical protein [Vibrio navarrensis]